MEQGGERINRISSDQRRDSTEAVPPITGLALAERSRYCDTHKQCLTHDH